MRKWILLCGFVAICRPGFSQDKTAYIELYKNIAVSEMIRSGIPASIKLAQAMLESNCGKSELACKANNHFGIKCGNEWSGKTFKKEDDDFEEGKLVKSCFREYRTPYDSYIAHSDFLVDQSKSKRYGFLFQLDVTDYKGWAKGLSKAGYATDPQYAHRLIDLIERYELFRFDYPDGGELASAEPESSLALNLVQYHNDVKYALAHSGDTPMSIAKKYDVTPKQIVRYNDDIDDVDQGLTEGTKVYLQPKRAQSHGKQKSHLIKPGETMISISQEYGIKLDALLKRNGLTKGEIPAPNQKVLLKGKSGKPLKTVDPYDIPEIKPGPIPEKVITEKTSRPNTSVVESTPSVDNNKINPVETGIEVKKPIINDHSTSSPDHIVAKGETLYSIARQYEIPLTDLKKLNNLSADTIFIGQKLVLK